MLTFIPCVTYFEMEKQFQQVYTHAKFKELQMELTEKLYCDVFSVDAMNGIFKVVETIFFEDREKEMSYDSQFNKEKCEIECTCHLFKFRGILCRHALCVLIKMQVKKVSEKYILSRWRKDVRRSHSRIKFSDDGWIGNPET